MGANVAMFAASAVGFPGGPPREPLAGKTPSRPARMQEEVRRGQAPRDVESVHRGHVPGMEPHVHYKDSTASTLTGKVSHSGRGHPNPSAETREWLIRHGWTPPPRLPR